MFQLQLQTRLCSNVPTAVQTHQTQSHIQMFVLFWSTDITLCHFVSLCFVCFSELRLFVQALWAENLLSSQKSSDVVSVVLCVPAQATMFTVFLSSMHLVIIHILLALTSRGEIKTNLIVKLRGSWVNSQNCSVWNKLCGHKESWRVKLQSPTDVISWSWLSERDQYLCVCWLMCLHYEMWWY